MSRWRSSNPHPLALSLSARPGNSNPFALSLSKGLAAWSQGFDKLSPNGSGRWHGQPQVPVLVLGVSEQGVAWLAPGSSEWQSWDWPQGLDGPTALCEWVLNQAPQLNTQRQAVQVCLAPGLARHWVQAVPDSTASLTELQAIAAARAQQLWGPGGWMVTGDWQHEGVFLCTAVPAAWEPAWAAMRERWGEVALHTPLLLAQRYGQTLWPHEGWLALAVARHLYVQRRVAGRVMSLRSVRWPAESTLETLQVLAGQEGHREMLRADSAQETLHWLAWCEGGGQAVAQGALKPLAWRDASATPAVALDASEAMHAAWCARQCLEGGWHAA